MNPSLQWIRLCAGSLGLSGVALGAFGAHALKANLAAANSLGTWQTAVLYHLMHSVAVLALVQGSATGQLGKWIARCWITGVILFSGSLYWLALGGPKWLGPITPLGGLAFLAGWLLVAISARRAPA